MDKKIVAMVVVAIAAIGIMAGCVEKPTPTPGPTPTEKSEEAPTPEAVSPVVTPAPTPEEELPTKLPTKTATSCDMCHKTERTANLKAHVEGEKSCMGSGIGSCHSGEKYGGADANVHTIHPPEAVGCAGCHGKIPSIPEKGPGGTTCEMCHGLPNPLEPSEGRLVEIHLGRGRDCTVCHVGEISEIHGLN